MFASSCCLREFSGHYKQSVHSKLRENTGKTIHARATDSHAQEPKPPFPLQTLLRNHQ